MTATWINWVITWVEIRGATPVGAASWARASLTTWWRQEMNSRHPRRSEFSGPPRF